jgi:uncharacterized protein YegL
MTAQWEEFKIDGANVTSKKVFPFYIVCDVSQSMWDRKFFGSQQVMTPLDTVEQALPDMIGVLEDDPTVYDTAYLSVVAFGDAPQAIMPLTPLSNNPSIPALPRQYATNYSAVFDFLVRQLSADHHYFTQSGLATYTPVIFFVTDGNPQVNGQPQTEAEWLPYRNSLEAAGFPFKPVLVALGIGNVTPETVTLLRSIVPKGAACVAENGSAPGDLLRSIIDSIKFSISSSVGHGDFVFATPSGMRRLD